MARRPPPSKKWSFSEFLNELEVRGQTWCIVECDAATGFSVRPDERLRFYAVLHGSARLAGPSDTPICLEQGSIAIVLSGEAHAIRIHPDNRTKTLDFMREGSHLDVPPILAMGEGPTATRLLCGRLKRRWPGGLVPSSLPAVLTAPSSSLLVDAKAMEASAVGLGASGLLTRVATLLLAQLLRRHAKSMDDFGATATEDPIARTLQLMDIHPAQPWTVASLARKNGMGRSSFATQFASATGRTPMEMLAERRMLIAEELLRNRAALKISEVAVRVGYRSEAAFIRRFVRHFGATPGMVRGVSPSSKMKKTMP